MTAEASTWFVDAVSHAGERGAVVVGGARIAFRAWGRIGDPIVVLVHGGAAHGGWWDHVAPGLSRRRRVVAIDLSGHGDSGWHDEYSTDRWVDEVLAVAASQGDGRPVIVGQSLGGIVALAAAESHGEALAGVVAVDSPPYARPAGLEKIVDLDRTRQGPRVTADRAALVARFRTMNPDPSTLAHVLAHIAEQSVVEADGGWRWKFDPRVLEGTYEQPDDIGSLPCRVAIVHAARGLAHRRPELFAEHPLPAHLHVTEIPDAGHDVMLDQPQALVAVIDALIGPWPVDRPTNGEPT